MCTAIEDVDSRQLEQRVVERRGHLTGAAAVAGRSRAVRERACGQIALSLVVWSHDLVAVKDVARLVNTRNQLASAGNIEDAVMVFFRVHHRIIRGVRRNRGILAQGIIRRGHRRQVRQLLKIDIAIAAHIVDDRPAVIHAPDGNRRAGIQHHPAFVLIAHGLADVACRGSLGDIGVLLRAVGRRRGRIHRRDAEDAVALDIRKVPLIAHDDPRRVNIQHFAARRGIADAENARAFDVAFHIAAGIRGHAGSIERRRIAVKIRQHFIRIDRPYHMDGRILVELRVVHFLIQLIFRQRHPGQRNAQHQQKGHQTFHLLSSPVETVSTSHYTIPLADRQGGGCRIYKFGVHSDAFMRFSDIFPFSRPYSPRS